VAGTETDSTGRDRHEMATESDVTRRRDTDPVPAAVSEFRRVTAPAMSFCTRRATPRRLSANRRRDEKAAPSFVLAAGSKRHLAKASSGPPEQRTYHRPRTPANNEMKLTSSASLGGRRLQLISVFYAPRGDRCESSSVRTNPTPYPGLATGADATPSSRLAAPASLWLQTPCPTRHVTALAARAKRRATPPLLNAETPSKKEQGSL
jgi:hypothetical protein